MFGGGEEPPMITLEAEDACGAGAQSLPTPLLLSDTVVCGSDLLLGGAQLKQAGQANASPVKETTSKRSQSARKRRSNSVTGQQKAGTSPKDKTSPKITARTPVKTTKTDTVPTDTSPVKVQVARMGDDKNPLVSVYKEFMWLTSTFR
jgi:hypothetical protein